MTVEPSLPTSPERVGATPTTVQHRASLQRSRFLWGFRALAALLERAQVKAVAVAVSLIAVVDTVASAWRPPRVPVDTGLLLFAFTAWALLFVAYSAFIALRAFVIEACRRFRPGVERPLLGAFDWLSFGALSILVQAPNVPARDVQLHVFYVMIAVAALGYVGVQWLERRVRGVYYVVRLLPAVLALSVATWAHWDRYEYVRIACLGVFVVGAVGSWNGFRSRRPEAAPPSIWLAPAVVGSALVTLVVAQLSFPHSHTARLVLYSRSAHAHSLLSPLVELSDSDNDGAATLFGGEDCNPRNRSVHPGATELRGNDRDDNCADGDGRRRSEQRSSPVEVTTPGRDVLLLSFDSLRWDAVEHLPKVRRALGQEIEFTRAVSPAAQTFYSLSATIRGKAVRQLNAKRSRRLWQDKSPTLADVLNAQGYRSFTVFTNKRWADEYGITGGFDVVWPMNRAARGAKQRYVEDGFVEADTAFTVALNVVRETRGPVLCWLHLMESHYPFHRGKRTGPPNREGFEAALRAVDVKAAAFIEAFRKARGSEPIIAIFGDHGEEFGEHGGLNHGNTVYSDQVRVGMSISLPEVSSRKIDAPISIGAIPATVLEQLGVEVPRSMTEPSVLEFVRGRGSAPQVAVSEMPTPTRYMVAYTGERYRLVTDPVHRTYELFDMETDPFEQTNLAASQPEVLAKMQALARDWNERH